MSIFHYQKIRYVPGLLPIIVVGACADVSLLSGSQTLLQNESPTTDICLQGVKDNSNFRIPYLPKPDLLNRYTDPALGATVVRITQSERGEVRKPAYSTMQAWNADETMLLTYMSTAQGYGYELRDGHSYELIGKLPLVPSDIEEVFWSHRNPDQLFYVSAAPMDFGHFKKFNVKTSESELIEDFSQWCGTSLPVAGGDVQMQSRDDDAFGFRCKNKNSDPLFFVYRLSTGKMQSTLSGEAGRNPYPTAPAATASGTRYWHHGNILGMELQPSDIKTDIHSFIEHSSLGVTHSGDDALYQVAYQRSPQGCNSDPESGIGHLVQHNFETGECRNIISSTQGYPYPTSSTHLSALSTEQPGRVAMSSIGSVKQMRYLSNNEPAPPLLSEVYLADITADEATVCRLAHHRSFGKNAKNGGYEPYFGEPHASISPSGTRIIFGSDWYDSGSVDSYVIELPEYKSPLSQ